LGTKGREGKSIILENSEAAIKIPKIESRKSSSKRKDPGRSLAYNMIIIARNCIILKKS